MAFSTFDKFYTKSPKTKKVNVLNSVNCTLLVPFPPTSLEIILNEI